MLLIRNVRKRNFYPISIPNNDTTKCSEYWRRWLKTRNLHIERTACWSSLHWVAPGIENIYLAVSPDVFGEFPKNARTSLLNWMRNKVPSVSFSPRANYYGRMSDRVFPKSHVHWFLQTYRLGGGKGNFS